MIPRIPKAVWFSLILWAPALAQADTTVLSTENSVSSQPSYRVGATGHVMLLNTKDSEDPAGKSSYDLIHENKLSAEINEFQGDLSFTNRWNPNGNKAQNSYITLEKKSLTTTWSSGSITLGDSYQELGKGIALALYRDPNFGLDTTLEGISLKHTIAPVTFATMAGRVNALKNPVALNPVANPVFDREMFLASQQLSTRVSPDVEVGSHYLFTTQRPLDKPTFDKKWHTMGVTLAMNGILDVIDVYAETNALLTQAAGDNKNTYPAGWGTFASIAWADAGWRVKMEGKDYRKYYYDFRRPPTLEDDIVATLNTQDVTATRLSAERQLAPKTAVYGSFLVGSDRAYHGELRHGIVGGKFLGPWRSAIELKAGYRFMPGMQDMSHLGAKLKVPTFKGESFELEYRKQLANKELNTYRVIEDRNQTFVTYNFSERWNGGLGVEFVPTNPEPVQAVFYSANASYKAGPYQAKAFVGQTSGGTICSGGVCRLVPPFSGAYLEGVYTF